MKPAKWCLATAALLASAWPVAMVSAAETARDSFLGDAAKPLSLSDSSESVYAPPSAPSPNQGVNAGAANIDIRVSYMTDYVYRGIEPFDNALGHEDASNYQFEGKLSFDLGKLPHPFIGLFTNIAETDEISNFEEIRPYFGADWTLKPFTFTGGLTSYIYPDRDEMQTAEIFGKIQLDDGNILRLDEPLFSPYVYAAYDYEKYNGWYFEAGVEHNFILEDTGITLTVNAAIAYTSGHEFFAGSGGKDTGFQHYQIGLIGTYSLNTLFNVSKRYGDWNLQGFLYYVDGLDDALRADTQLYGGVAIDFRY